MVSFYAGADYRAQITQRDGSDAGTIIGVAGVQGALSSRVSLFLEGGYGAGLQKNDDDVRVTDRRPDRRSIEILKAAARDGRIAGSILPKEPAPGRDARTTAYLHRPPVTRVSFDTHIRDAEASQP
jgi:hypothetical protein